MISSSNFSLNNTPKNIHEFLDAQMNTEKKESRTKMPLIKRHGGSVLIKSEARNQIKTLTSVKEQVHKKSP
jgi:hypothetical protein